MLARSASTATAPHIVAKVLWRSEDLYLQQRFCGTLMNKKVKALPIAVADTVLDRGGENSSWKLRNVF